jgi:hypothetical protein
MTTAWVITQEGTHHTDEQVVIAILSARKSARAIKEHVEWLYALLRCDPERHLALAKYRNPEIPWEAEFDKTNTGVPVMRCGNNPWLVARLAKSVSLIPDDRGGWFLQWANPPIRICDTKFPPNIIEKRPGAKCQAPVHLPILRERAIRSS